MSEDQMRWLMARGVSRNIVVILDVLMRAGIAICIVVPGLLVAVFWFAATIVAFSNPRYQLSAILLMLTFFFAVLGFLLWPSIYEESNQRVPRRKEKELDND